MEFLFKGVDNESKSRGYKVNPQIIWHSFYLAASVQRLESLQSSKEGKKYGNDSSSFAHEWAYLVRTERSCQY